MVEFANSQQVYGSVLVGVLQIRSLTEDCVALKKKNIYIYIYILLHSG